MRTVVPLSWVLALLFAFAPSPARAEVTAERKLVEHTGYTLRDGEWKIGLRESSWGLTDRLQLNSYLLATLALLNLGAKYQLVDAPNLAVAAKAWGGVSALPLIIGAGGGGFGAGLDATFPLTDRLAFNAGLEWTFFGMRTLVDMPLLESGRISYWTVRSHLHYLLSPRHTFFLSLSSPTSWYTALNDGAHDFDMLDFANGTVGYQYSAGIFNFRLNAGWGPSLFGRGPTVGLDLYLRGPKFLEPGLD